MSVTDQEYSLQEMVRAIRERRQPETNGKDNLKSVGMVFAAVESIKRGRPTDLVRYPPLGRREHH